MNNLLHTLTGGIFKQETIVDKSDNNLYKKIENLNQINLNIPSYGSQYNNICNNEEKSDKNNNQGNDMNNSQPSLSESYIKNVYNFDSFDYKHDNNNNQDDYKVNVNDEKPITFNLNLDENKLDNGNLSYDTYPYLKNDVSLKSDSYYKKDKDSHLNEGVEKLSFIKKKDIRSDANLLNAEDILEDRDALFEVIEDDDTINYIS